MFDLKNLEIHTKNISLSDEQKELIQEKFQKLAHLSRRLNDESTRIRVEIDHDTARAKEMKMYCAVTIFAPAGVTLRAEAHSDTWRNVIDACKHELIPQIDRYKEKHG